MAKSPKKSKRSPAKKKSAKPGAKPKKNVFGKTMQAMSEPKFSLLLKQVKAHDGRRIDEGAEVSSLIAKAVKNDHLDKKAFSMFRALDKMEDAKLATTLAHFDHYRRIGKLDKRATAQQMVLPRTEIGEKPRKVSPKAIAEMTAEAKAADQRRAGMGIPSVVAGARNALPSNQDLAGAMAAAIEADKPAPVH